MTAGNKKHGGSVLDVGKETEESMFGQVAVARVSVSHCRGSDGGGGGCVHMHNNTNDIYPLYTL